MTINEARKLAFTKMQGCGNDYIYVDCLEGELPDPEGLAVRLSDRHYGVGGDGLVLILPSHVADARMRMFNLDGSEGGMCGNAIRCVAKYLYDSGIIPKTRLQIETRSGVKELELFTEQGRTASVRVNMGRPELAPDRIPVSLTGKAVIARPVTVGGAEYPITCVSMGNPHAVVFREQVEDLNLCELGPLFEHHILFPARVNTEFVAVAERNLLRMRVWERGSGETLACGTGACAAAVAAVLNGLCDWDADIRVELPGGVLTVRYTGESVWMTGPCETVFNGVVEL